VAPTNRWTPALLLGVALVFMALPGPVSASDPCAKQLTMLRAARAGARRAAARRQLNHCRYAHAVSIAPANPHANKTLIVTIHPWWKLGKG